MLPASPESEVSSEGTDGFLAGLHQLEFGEGVCVHSLVVPLEAVKQPAQGASPRPRGSWAHGSVSTMVAPTLLGAFSAFHPWRAIP
jgi:hypothetical protein